MKKLLISIGIMLFAFYANANHLKGGWIQYEYIGPGAAAGTVQYRITVRQYLNCTASGGQIDASIFLGVFNN